MGLEWLRQVCRRGEEAAIMVVTKSVAVTPGAVIGGESLIVYGLNANARRSTTGSKDSWRLGMAAVQKDWRGLESGQLHLQNTIHTHIHSYIHT